MIKMTDTQDKGGMSDPVIQKPSLSELSELSEELGLQCSEDELARFHEKMSFDGIDKVLNNLVSPTLPVKYPRTRGYRPEPGDNEFNAWYWKCDIEGAKEGILKGKTIGIKDCVCVADVPMMNGSNIMEGFVPDIDATVVTRILDAGGRIVGKTNCENFCFSTTSVTNDTGPTLNPVDKSRTSGGSSSGSAAAVCSGDVDMAIGGDQGGSIRIPSSWCGIVGLKPTWGLVPYTGTVSIETTIDHIGPMAKNVYDCALLLEAIAGYDEGRDPRQPRRLEVPKYTKLLDGKLSAWKIGLVTEGFTGCDAEVQSIVRDAARQLSKAGAEIEEVSIPMHNHGITIWATICMGAYQCMVKGAGVGCHYKGYYPESLMRKLVSGFKEDSKMLPEALKSVILKTAYTEKKYGNQFYGRAQNLNMELTKAYDTALTKFDVIIMPTLTFTAPLLPKENASYEERSKCYAGIKNVAPFDCTGHPAITLDAGKSEGLPVGMMIVGNQFDDAKVLQAAYAFEQLQNES